MPQSTKYSPVAVAVESVLFDGAIHEERFYTYAGRYEIMVKRTSFFKVEFGIVDTFEGSFMLTVRSQVGGSDVTTSSIAKGNTPVYVTTAMDKYSDKIVLCYAKDKKPDDVVMFTFSRQMITNHMQLDIYLSTPEKPVDLSGFIHQGRA